MSSLVFFLMVLHIYAYAISRRFITRARVGEDILDLCGLLIALATLDPLLLDHVCDGFAHGVDVV